MYLQPTTTYGSLIPGSEYIRSLVRQETISTTAAARLKWMDHYSQHGNARLTCRHFDISPQTFYRWKRRFDPYDLTTLEDGSHRPRPDPADRQGDLADVGLIVVLENGPFGCAERRHGGKEVGRNEQGGQDCGTVLFRHGVLRSEIRPFICGAWGAVNDDGPFLTFPAPMLYDFSIF